MKRLDEDLIRRIHEDLRADLDEELELEFEDRNIEHFAGVDRVEDADRASPARLARAGAISPARRDRRRTLRVSGANPSDGRLPPPAGDHRALSGSD